MKTMKPYKFTIIAALFLLIFNACEEVIDVKINDENLDLYAVEARITTVGSPTVYLYKSLQVTDDSNYSGVSGATVTIADDQQPANQVQLVESPETKGLYIISEKENYVGVAGREYTLQIQHDGVTITGKEKLNQVEPIDSIQVRPSLRGEKRFLGIFTYGNEPQGTGNFYKWDIYVNGKLVNDSEYLMVASDELVDGNYISNFEIFTDFYDLKKPEDRILKLESSILVKQNSISEFAYNFYYQMLNQNYAGGMFSVPPANIESNLRASNGKRVLGIFTASDVSDSNVVSVTPELDEQLKD